MWFRAEENFLTTPNHINESLSMKKNIIKYTPANLKKVENLFKEIGYKIIYEKGQFQSGYCIVNERKMIVINKFYKTDARINCLIAILNEIDILIEGLDEETLTFYQTLVEHMDSKEN